jgi:hypothetical protein
LLVDDLGRGFDTLLKLRHMEDIMNSYYLRRKLKAISYGSTDFENFKRSNISRSKFSSCAEPLNTSGRRYSMIYEITNFKL